MTTKALKGFLSIIASFLSGCLFTGCNSDSSSTIYSSSSYGSTAITAFSLQSNSKVLNNLDSIFFSINLDKATIFNASPMPVGTDVSSLLINLSTDNCSEVELRFTTKYGNDTTINYLESTTDSINFADGPVTVHVVSYDRINSRDYNISVNVFEENPDSLVWRRQSSVLPTTYSTVLGSKSIQAGDSFYCLTYDGSGYQLAKSTQLYDFEGWENVSSFDISAVQGRVLESFTGNSEGNLYILDAEDVLWESTDEGASWTSTGLNMQWIYGSYEEEVLGSLVDGSDVYSVSYPTGNKTLQAADFPVKGTSNLMIFNSEWEVQPMATFTGGKTALGDLSGDTWAYDGTQWAKISSGTMVPASYRSIFRYDIANTSKVNWRTTYQPVLFAIGGLTGDGKTIAEAWYSVDMGIHWEKAPSNYQVDSLMPGVWGASVLVDDYMLTDEYSWGNSRAVSPVTDWNCPFIYVAGGYNESGSAVTQLWQGVILRYTLIPLQ